MSAPHSAVETPIQVRYGDTVVVRAWMTSLKSRGCSFAYEVVLPDGHLAAEGETQHLFLDGSGKPRTVPKAIADAFRSFMGPTLAG